MIVEARRGIGWAVAAMRDSQGVTPDQVAHVTKVRRAGWNGKGMYIYMLSETPPRPWRMIVLRTQSGELVPWTCSQTDLLATDWELAE